MSAAFGAESGTHAQSTTRRKTVAYPVEGVLDAAFFLALCEPARLAFGRRLVPPGASDLTTIA